MATIPPVTVNIVGDSKGLSNELNKVNKQLAGIGGGAGGGGGKSIGGIGGFGGGVSGFTKLGGAMTKMLAPLAAVTAGFIGIRSAVGFFSGAISEASNMEVLEGQFATLLGSAEAADQRIRELVEIADWTPFGEEKVMQASKTLQALTGDALSTGDGLKLVLDTAATLDPSKLDSFTMHIGRLYAQLQNGKVSGKSLSELTQLGAIDSSTIAEVERLQKAGADSAQIWDVLQGRLLQYEGGAKNLATTTSGWIDGLGEQWKKIQLEFGRPIAEALKPLLESAFNFMAEMRPLAATIGEKVAEIIKAATTATGIVQEAFAQGKIGELFGLGLKIGALEGLNYLFRGMDALYVGLVSILSETFAMVAQPEFWKGLVNVFAGLGQVLIGVVGVFNSRMALALFDAGRGFRTEIAAVALIFGDRLGGVMKSAVFIFRDMMLTVALKVLEVLEPIAGFFGFDMSNIKSGIESERDANMREQVEHANRTPLSKEDAVAQIEQVNDAVRFGLQSAFDLSKDKVAEGVDNLFAGASQLAPILGEAGANVYDAMQNAFKNSEGGFDTSADKEALKNLVESLKPEIEEYEEPGKAKGAALVGGSKSANKDFQEAVADSLTAIGGGGGFGFGGMETETEKQTTLLDQIEQNTRVDKALAPIAVAEKLNDLTASSTPALGPVNQDGSKSGDTAIFERIAVAVEKMYEIMKNGGGTSLTVEAV